MRKKITWQRAPVSKHDLAANMSHAERKSSPTNQPGSVNLPDLPNAVATRASGSALLP
ncbi:hypothetical protein Dimus_006062, partial [Dionaea muscipula]